MKFCAYHGSEWETLVESGWITRFVEEIRNVRVACMVNKNWKGGY